MEDWRERLYEVLEQEVRPALLEHEGDLEVVSLEGGVLKIRLLGRCSGCPSARLTTEEMIAAKVKARMPEVTDVVLVQEVSEELWDFAKKVLRHEVALCGLG